MPKVYYVPVKNDLVGYFKELDILPTHNLYYGNDEFIPNDEHIYLKVLKS